MNSSNIHDEFIAQEGLSQAYLEQASKFFLPAASFLADLSKPRIEPLFVSLVGCQGSGKTTLSKYLKLSLEAQGIKTLVLSIDDFYLSHSARQDLAANVHPLLATRGVPGTHNIALLSECLQQLKRGGQISKTPIFDKSIDDLLPESQWCQHAGAYDLVLLEGWCWGALHVSSDLLATPINRLERDEDPNCIWRNFVNKKLTSDYEPLYPIFDIKLALKAPSFESVYAWRLEQESKLRAKLNAKPLLDKGLKVMSAEEIARFIQHYQRVTSQLLDTPDSNWDLTWRLNKQRAIVAQSFSGAFAELRGSNER